MKFSYLAGGLGGKVLVAAGVFVGMLAVSAPASADSFTATFFKVSTSSASNSDFHTGNVPTGTDSDNEVMSGLLGGMPVYNSGHDNLSGTVVGPNDLGGGGAIEWWTPGTYGVNTVTYTGTNTSFNVSTDPTHPTNMFPDNSGGTTNQDGFEETAILSGQFTLGAPGTFTMSIAADDDAFIFVDGTYIGGLGGIQAIGNTC